jgi:hypothetical protein
MRAQVTRGEGKRTAGEQEAEREDSGENPDALGAGAHNCGGAEQQHREPLEEEGEAQCTLGGVVHGFSFSFGGLERLLDGLDKDLEGLGAGDAVLTIEDKERDAIRAESSCEFGV